MENFVKAFAIVCFISGVVLSIQSRDFGNIITSGLILIICSELWNRKEV